MGTKIKVTQYEGEKIIPSDVYEAIVKSYSFGEGSFGEYVKLEFSISTGAYEGTAKSLIASRKIQKSPKGSSKLMNVIETILATSLSKDEDFDLDSIIGKRCRIILSEPITKDGVQYQKVTEVMASKL